jgi:hypothetical protein
MNKSNNKATEAFNFNKISDFDVTNIKRLVSELTEEDWLENTTRQKYFKTVHASTNTYFLADCSLDWEIKDGYETQLIRPESEMWAAVYPIVKLLEDYHDGKVGRVIIPKLFAGTKIPSHKDSGEYLEIVRRHHIAIITNDDIFFSVGDETINMREGEIWEINNNLNHAVDNNSDIDRVHVIIDIIPNTYIAN